MEEKWVDLIYNGINFGDKFEISSNGMIRNKKTGNYSKASWYGLIRYTNIYYGHRSYRIKIGLAQEESGLERTIFDRISPSRQSLEARIHELESLVGHLLVINNLENPYTNTDD